jgi:hypothetical protein
MNDFRQQEQNSTWLSCSGKIEVDNGVRIVTDVDICQYYRWFIKKEFWETVKTQIPKHKGHITIVNPKIHNVTDFSSVQDYHNREVLFDICPEQMYMSKVNFWIPARAAIEHEIKWLCAAKDKENYWGLHLTVANKKFN